MLIFDWSKVPPNTGGIGRWDDGSWYASMEPPHYLEYPVMSDTPQWRVYGPLIWFEEWGIEPPLHCESTEEYPWFPNPSLTDPSSESCIESQDDPDVSQKA